MLGGKQPTELTRQNIQARIRGQRMWNWANSSGALFLQTGDMSEKAVGYTTIGGDLEGALSVIANVPKTVVIALLERLETRFGFKGVSATLHTDPGPELADKQVAENELMPFPVLDACLHLYAGEKMSPDDIGAALKALFPDYPADQLGRLGRTLHHAVFTVDLQVGAVAAVAARRLARPRSRARAADAGRSDERMVLIADVQQSRRPARRRLSAVADPDRLIELGVFVAEGRLVVRRLIDLRHWPIESILLTQAAADNLADVLPLTEAPIYRRRAGGDERHRRLQHPSRLPGAGQAARRRRRSIASRPARCRACWCWRA